MPTGNDNEKLEAIAKEMAAISNSAGEAHEILRPVKFEIDYCFSEDEYLAELKRYIDKTYGQHYAQSKIQSTEFIMDAGHGTGFCIGNIIKYAQRYGKKEGYNRADLLKVCHYAIMSLHVHDQFNSKENQ